MPTRRTTENDARAAFKTLARYMGKSTDWQEPGAWRLDCNATYGGCVIAERSVHGGEIHRGERVSPATFVYMAHFAMSAIEVERKRAGTPECYYCASPDVAGKFNTHPLCAACASGAPVLSSPS